ncbi:MAG: hypothetical protein AABZ60_09795 [Planctomycetota bacterium]
MTDYSPYQKRIIRRYYNQQDNILISRLSEIVSEMYLVADNPKEMKKLWNRAEKALAKIPIPESRRKVLLEKKELKALADFLNEAF